MLSFRRLPNKKREIQQVNHKYNSKEYASTVRFTKRKFVLYVVFATNHGDKIVAQATSAELPRYGTKTVLKNHSAAYLTGVLAARRALNKFGFDETLKGYDEADGEECHVEDEGDNAQSPVKCTLDVGVKKRSLGTPP